MVLVSTPWPLFNRPSIQIGTLQAYLRARFPDLKVDAHHFYLRVAEAIGYRRYQAISERTWLAEAICGALLYPERIEHIAKIFYRQAAGIPLLQEVVFETLITRVQKVSENFIQVAETLNLAAIVCYTASGATSLRAARERPKQPILALTPIPATGRKLAIVWGLHCVLTDDPRNLDDMVEKACRIAYEEGFARQGEQVIITAGIPMGLSGATNLLRIAEVDPTAND